DLFGSFDFSYFAGVARSERLRRACGTNFAPSPDDPPPESAAKTAKTAKTFPFPSFPSFPSVQSRRPWELSHLPRESGAIPAILQNSPERTEPPSLFDRRQLDLSRRVRALRALRGEPARPTPNCQRSSF